MARFDIKAFLPHIALVALAALLIGGLFSLAQTEQKKTRDIIRMQEALGIRSALQLYYINHAAYPPSPNGPFEVGANDQTCLSDTGFVPTISDSCAKKAYSRVLPVAPRIVPQDAYIYTPLGENGVDPCTSSAACPHFSISVTFETGVLYSKGTHIVTDQGMR